MSYSGDTPVRPSIPRRRFPLIRTLVGAVVSLGVLFFIVMWYGLRVEVNANEILVLVNKTGKQLPAELFQRFGDQVVLYPAMVDAIAAETGESAERVRERYKGIRYEVLTEGRYFPNPYSYQADQDGRDDHPPE